MRRKRIQLEHAREYDEAVVQLKQKVGGLQATPLQDSSSWTGILPHNRGDIDKSNHCHPPAAVLEQLLTCQRLV